MPDGTAYSLTGPAALDLAGVTVTIDGQTLLDSVTVRTHDRRIGIVGRNGSGKTTLARAIAGLITPDEGKVHVAGVDVARDRRAALRAVGILFQNPDHQIIFPTVDEEIAFGLTQQGMTRAEAANHARAILMRFGKAHWSGAAIQPLSHGQKQLVCLMAILAMAPKVIILDEPFSGLDLPTRMQLSRHLNGIDATLIQISHDPETLAEYDRVIWIDGGRCVAEGAADRTLAAYTRRMTELGAADDLSDVTG